MIRTAGWFSGWLLIALAATAADAQTTTLTAQWEQSEAPAIVAGFTTSLKVDAAAAIPASPVCVANGTGTRCTLVLAPSVDPKTSHTVVITEANALGVGTSSTGYTPPSAAPSNPTNIKIIVNITVP